ncbi:MAG TPA: NifU family protein [Candidatus Dormibacteraeota bacterium]
MPTPTVHITEFARQRLEEVRANRRQPEAGMRIAITGRQEGAFTYDLQLAANDDVREDELVVEGPDGVRFHLPKASAAYLDGITVDADVVSGALQIDNPNPLWLEPLNADVQAFLDAEINPAVAGHGGHIDLLDVSDGIAYIHMGGGCQGCGLASVTLGQGVRVALLERFPDIIDVLDTTDHAAGKNPYYEASKK